MTSPYEPLDQIQNHFKETIPHSAFYQNLSECLAQLTTWSPELTIEMS